VAALTKEPLATSAATSTTETANALVDLVKRVCAPRCHEVNRSTSGAGSIPAGPQRLVTPFYAPLFCREPVATWSPPVTALAAQPDCVQVVLADLWRAADEILDVVVLGVDVAARELVGTA
jgi:hypothetical protein